MLYVRRDLAARAPAIFAALEGLQISGRADGLGNRGSGFRLKLDGGLHLFARVGRRGGLVARMFTDLYFGAATRPLKELAVTTEARIRGIPVAEPLGAVIETVTPGIYRGIFLTRALTGMTLWEFLRTDDDSVVRRHVVGQARAAIDVMHRGGLLHADLNLHNLFVTRSGDGFGVIILDLDKARIFPDAISPTRRRANFARLTRSARTLDPARTYLDAATLAVLTAM